MDDNEASSTALVTGNLILTRRSKVSYVDKLEGYLPQLINFGWGIT